MISSAPPATDTPGQAAGKLSAALIASTVAAALGGLLFGFDTAVISGTTTRLQELFQLDDYWLGFTVATAMMGTILGSIFAGQPTDRWGRKKALLALAVLYLVGSIGSALAWDWLSFVVFRFIGGIAVGGASVVSPLYIAEISPARYRGRLVAIQQFNIVLGILLAFLSNYAIARFHLGGQEWRWMLGVQAIPSLLFLLMVLPISESPRWLMARGRAAEARGVLARLGYGPAEVESEIRRIEESHVESRAGGQERLFQFRYRWPILLAVTIAAFNQLSGINAVMYYAPKVFEMAGAGKRAALLQAVALGGTNLVFTMLALSVIDRFGRRKLMLAGSIGYLVSLSLIAGAFYTYGNQFTTTGSLIVLGGLILFIAAHAFGQGAVIWVFISEIFPNRVRARGQGLGSTTHWVLAAIITWTFPIIAKGSGGHAFAFYAGMMFLQLLWVLFVMPETRGVPLEEIQKRFKID